MFTKHYWVFYRHVASNPNAPAHLLKRIANFPDVTTRCNIAKHNNTPESVLEKLARDKDISVRRAVKDNPNTPALVLEQILTEDTNPN
ncbi:MAG: hypothetical protein KME64_04700 [Scytonematopsis contorta HA4267-MV1]|jgi:hypothetical protein|nr:hypothetical protein [Scytonematopsis contorta HA4267-MV1]